LTDVERQDILRAEIGYALGEDTLGFDRSRENMRRRWRRRNCFSHSGIKKRPSARAASFSLLASRADVVVHDCRNVTS
jgi:hypothetical protein